MAELEGAPPVEENEHENGNVAAKTTTSAPTHDDPRECREERDCMHATCSVDIQRTMKNQETLEQNLSASQRSKHENGGRQGE